jgi:hypothetical protein
LSAQHGTSPAGFDGNVLFAINESMPVSTFHACTSPKWSAPGAIDAPKPDTPPKLRPGSYVTGTPMVSPHRLLVAGLAVPNSQRYEGNWPLPAAVVPIPAPARP